MISIAFKKYQLATLIVAILLVTTATFGLAGDKAQPAKETTSEKIIATVNGEPIYEEQVDAVISSRIGQSKYAQTLFDNAQKKAKLQKQALDQIIPSNLIYQESLKLTISDLETKIDQLTTTFKNHPLGRYNGKSDAQLREMAKQQIYAGEYFKVNNFYTPTISETEIKNYYEQNKQSFAAQEDSVHVRHIIVSCTDEMSTEEKTLALEKITAARKMIAEGNEFSEIALNHSEDNAAGSGGDIGFINRGYMPPEFDSVAFNIEIGKLSKIIKTSFGYHILEVMEVNPKGTIPPYENLKEFFGEFLQNQKSKKVIDQHITALREKAEIEIFIKD